MGRSRGGLTTKIHALTDAQGLPLKLVLTPGQAADCPIAAKLLGRLRERRPRLKALVITGHGDILEREVPEWWRSEAHLAKPFTLAALREAVARLIGEPSAG